MKNCNKEGCQNQIEEKYTFCFNHYQPAKTDMKSGQWHNDPIVDALLKLNANLGKIGQLLEAWVVWQQEKALEKNLTDVPSMKRSKPGIDDAEER